MNLDVFAGLTVCIGIGSIMVVALIFKLISFFKHIDEEFEKKVFSVMINLFFICIGIVFFLSLLTGEGCGGGSRIMQDVYDY